MGLAADCRQMHSAAEVLGGSSAAVALLFPRSAPGSTRLSPVARYTRNLTGRIALVAPCLLGLTTEYAMTDIDPIEPVSDDDLGEPVARELARIREEVRRVAQQVGALAAEVARIQRHYVTGRAHRGADEHDRWATYAMREQQMTRMLTNLVFALQTFLQQRAATPLP